jgi:AcrR family transcriptional regulator
MPAVSLHDARLAVVRDRVIEGVAAVLAAADDLTFARVAAAAEVPERTVYRHFPTRQALLAAVFDWVNERVGPGKDRPTTADEAGEMVRRAFTVFDEVAPVVRELLAAREGLPARLADNDRRQRAALDVVRHHVPNSDPTTARRLAAVVQLLTSAAAWQTMRDYWEFDGPEAAEASAMAVDLLLRSAADSQSGRAADRRRSRSTSRKGPPS